MHTHKLYDLIGDIHGYADELAALPPSYFVAGFQPEKSISNYDLTDEEIAITLSVKKG